MRTSYDILLELQDQLIMEYASKIVTSISLGLNHNLLPTYTVWLKAAIMSAAIHNIQLTVALIN